MSEDSLKHKIEDLSMKLDYYMTVNKACYSAMKDAEDFGYGYASLNQLKSEKVLIEEAFNRIKRHVPFQSAAFLLIDEKSSEFYIDTCWPETSRPQFEMLLEESIINGNFTFTMRERKGKYFHTKGDTPILFMHSVSTVSRARGMFMGTLEHGEKDVSFVSDTLITFILQQSAYLIESYRLYGILREKNKELNSQFRNKMNQYEISKDFERVLNQISTRFIGVSNANLKELILDSLSSLGNFVKSRRQFLAMFEYGQELEHVDRVIFGGLPEEKHSFLFHASSKLCPNLNSVVPEGKSVDVVSHLNRMTFNSQEWQIMGGGCFKDGLFVSIESSGKRRGLIGFLFNEPLTNWDCGLNNLLKLTGEIYLQSFNRVQMENSLKRSREELILSQKMEAIGLMAGGIAHDFNNILTAINGNVELLMMNPNAAQAMDKLKQVLDASKRGAELTRQLLSISKKQFIEQEIVEINQSVKSLYSIMKRLVEEDIEISLELSGKDIFIVADKGQLDQLIMNLIVNARDAINECEKSNNRHIVIKTKLYCVSDKNFDKWFVPRKGRYLLLEVSDTGMGMDKETSARIFEPFFTTKDNDKGTGLGLATVYGIIKQHKGCIVVDSDPGQGTMFRILWPLADKVTESESFSDDSSEVIGGRETILLVEDDTAVLESVADSLKIVGYKVIKAENGHEALRKMKSHPNIDLIMSDNKMPGMSGLDLINTIKESRHDLKAILSSGYTDVLPEAMKHEDSGFLFIQKPYTIREVIDAIRILLN